MNGKLRNVSQVSPYKQKQAQSLGQSWSSIHNISLSSIPPVPSIPPFVQGDRIRPRYPWHLWRQYPVIVDECYLASTSWLIKVRVVANSTFSATVLASDFEHLGVQHLGVNQLNIKQLDIKQLSVKQLDLALR
ncbi:MAG: hypothetical protein QNJ46_15835 [Leptolyngbyaceae cyanobacterium MO_188.B28]|nr:hypothetical protein [Leptolyngbyaceae cyanobacterium MO_188.B28]